MTKILQSIPYPTYTTANRDLLTGVLLNTKINNSTTNKVNEWNGSSWIESGSDGGHTITDSDETFPQESELQFTGNVIVSAGTGKTVINIPDQTITIDSVPTDGSTSAVASNGVFDALANKVDKNTVITGATKTKVTYDAKGLVTSGEDATTADIADSLDKRYVTEAEKVDIAKIDGIQTQISANQLTFASIYGYYNFI